MKKWFKNLSVEDLSKGGIIVGIAGVVVGAVADIVDKVRHDRRENMAYEKVMNKLDDKSIGLLGSLDILNEIRNGEDEEEA